VASSERRYWLMKTEPNVFSIDDLQRLGKSAWDGVRNFRARNYMKKEMAVGDLVLFYHSSVDPPGVAGLARVASESYADPTQFDPASQYHDPKSRREAPRWWLVDLEFVAKAPEFVPLGRLRQEPSLAAMPLLKRGMRLSVQAVEVQHFARVLELAGLQLPAAEPRL
jgi:predicted RNA-binding protein with PUA-like domain